ncbi:hypothetical protein BT93_L0964 [Corymbia citriodora subsp. variegata]|uniref:PITH domain-containing protein n=1 Tax=Corymbia citriodora subsp. variegata TaxID=360336 RepID=A0A8T0CEK4_CORYI|nr:hypothetical protein BT93_L0964 [Corymbia citriodora subsp. variegata]
MSCEHEHHSHGHGHGDHDHSHDLEPALQSSLYKQIEFDKVHAFNEATAGSAAGILRKTWTDRLSDQPILESDSDEQILLHIPFSGSCKLYSLLIRTSNTENAPAKLKMFRNRTDLDFSACQDLKATQSIDLPRSNEIADIALNRAHWNGTTSVDLFFESNHSGGEEDLTHIFYLGFKGDFMALNREPIHVLYEAAANPKDHKVIQGLTNINQSSLGQ